MNPPHIEIKTRYVDTGDVKAMMQKGTIVGLVTAGKISKPAKKLLDEANIAWAEKVSRQDFDKLAETLGEPPC